MRIVQVVTQLELGGAQTAALAFANELRVRGHEVETWFLYTKHVAFEGEPHVRVLRGSHPGVTGLGSLFPELCRLLRESRPAAVIGYTHYASILAGLAGLAARISVRLATIREPVSGYPTAARVIDRVLGSVGVYSSIVAVSASAADSCARYPSGYRRRLTVIRNGDVLRASFPNREDARHSLGISADEKILLHVGRLAAVKNQRFLLRLLPKLPQWRLLLVGEGPDRTELITVADQLGVGSRVRFVGQVARRSVVNYLSAADVFTFPSHHEGFGFAVLEALGAGLPVVAHDIPSLREMLSDGPNGPAGSVLPLSEEQWVDAISELDRTPSLAADRREKARLRARDFSFDAMVDGYLSLLEGRGATGIRQ